MKTLVSLKDLSHQDWLKARGRGIGSSDAATVIGINPWKSRIQLWGEKCGLIEPDDLSDNESVEWGTILEDPVAKKYQRVTGREITPPSHIYRHEKHDWMIGNPDRFIEGDPRGTGILEVKTTSAFHAKDWDEEPPEYYQAQLQHLLAVTGCSWGSFAVLIGGQRFKWCDVERNERFIEFLTEKESEFWDMVLKGDPPDPDASDSAKEALARLYPKESKDVTVDLGDEALEWANALQAVREAQKELDKSRQYAENMLKAAIGEAAIGKLPDGRMYSWKVQHRDSYVVPANDYRVLREIKSKGGGK